MPYIKQERRDAMRNTLEPKPDVPQNAGELNYVFTSILLGYIERKGLCYQTINDIIGALEGAKLEFYRRAVAPYEDTKIKENGDAY